MTECRICLVDNVRMQSLFNTRLKEIFEKLSGAQLSKDGRPNTICFLCCSQLQKIGKFLDMVQEAENIFNLRHLGGTQMSEKIHDLKLYNLKITEVQSSSYVDTGEDIEPEVTVTIKEEPIDFEDTEEYREEYLDISPAAENLQDKSMEVPPMVNIPSPTNEPDNQLKIPISEETNRFSPDSPLNYNDIEASIKKEPDEDITESILRNLTIVLETLPDTNLKLPKRREYKYFCSICNHKSRTTKGFQMHCKVHDPNHNYVCKFCSFRFISDKKLAAHRNRCTVCSICGKKFSNNHGLRIHVRLHTGIQPYSCDICGRGFNQKTNLRTHMRVHTRHNQFPCEICNKTFPFKTFLERHKLIHTDNLDSDSVRRTINCHKLQVRKKTKPRICGVCGRTLQSKHSLEVHMRQHTGLKPYSCEACYRVFTQKCNLLTHVERVHNGDELFTCKLCPIVFPFNSDLKQHMLSHRELLAQDFEVFQQKYVYTIHKYIGHMGFSPYACEMCKTRVYSY